jgi:hypothetical protein
MFGTSSVSAQRSALPSVCGLGSLHCSDQSLFGEHQRLCSSVSVGVRLVKVSPERSRVLEGTQPQYGHSPPTSSRSATASARCPEDPPRSLLQRRHHRGTRRRIPASTPYLRDHQRRRLATKKARAKRSRLSGLGIGLGSRSTVSLGSSRDEGVVHTIV